jgi:hypothetical protein
MCPPCKGAMGSWAPGQVSDNLRVRLLSGGVAAVEVDAPLLEAAQAELSRWGSDCLRVSRAEAEELRWLLWGMRGAGLSVGFWTWGSSASKCVRSRVEA